MLVYHQVEEFITANRLFLPTARLLVAVSGGADSLCLVDCLVHAGYAVEIAHFDHQLRPESGQEADYVRDVAASFRCEFHLGFGGDYGLSPTCGSLEAAARAARYRFLADTAHTSTCTVLVTGHHADDQVETILLHLIRGAGLEGLGGMRPVKPLREIFPFPWSGELQLARPLLDLSRHQLVSHCKARGLIPQEDASNFDQRFMRNRVRHELLPKLEEFNSGFRAALLRTGEIMRSVDSFMDSEVDQQWHKIVSEEADGYWIAREPFKVLPEAIQYMLAKKLLEDASGGLEIGYSAIQRLQAALVGDERTPVSLPGDLVCRCLGQRCRIAPVTRPLPMEALPAFDGDEPRAVAVPGLTALSPDWEIEAQTIDMGVTSLEDLIAGCGDHTIVLDADLLDRDLMVRVRRAGDRFQPFGMQGSMRLSDFFINEHVPEQARSTWPLLICGENIVWVAGERAGEFGRLSEKSRKALVLRLLPSGGASR